MPFQPEEKVNLRFEGDQETAVLEFEGRRLTVENGGLVAQRDGGLIAIVQLPRALGDYGYEFRDENGRYATGKLRVVEDRRPAGPPASDPAPRSVAPRPYRGR